MAAETSGWISALVRAGAVVTALLAARPAHAAADAPPPAAAESSASDDEVRRKLLIEHLPHVPTVFMDVAPAVVGTLGLAGSIAFLPDNQSETTTGTILVATSGVVSVIGFGSYLAPRQLRAPLIMSACSLWFSGFALGLYYDPSYSTESKQVLGIAAGTSALEAAIPLLDALLEPLPDLWAFESDRKALEMADQTTLHASVTRAERNLARLRRPLRFIGPTVYLAGVTGMALAAARAPQSDHAASLALGFGLIYSTLATLQLIHAIVPSPAQKYERALSQFKIVPVGPRGSAGASVLWQF